MSQESSRLFQWAKTRLSVVLGLLMLTFGFLKIVSPTIDGWFHVQIQQSHLPHSAILMGKIAEIVTGTLFLLPRLRPWRGTWESRILLIACSSLFLVMLVAIYVHLQPGVPSEVHPARHQAAVHPSLRRWSGYDGRGFAWKDTQELHLESAPDSVVTSNSLYP